MARPMPFRPQITGGVPGTLHKPIVVVGGGPAGASVATRAAQGLRGRGSSPDQVLVLERRYQEGIVASPHGEKVCGGMVMGVGLRFMRDSLGMEVTNIPQVPIDEVRISNLGFLREGLKREHFDQKHLKQASRFKAPGWGSVFHRRDLDTALLRHAQGQGAHVMTGARVTKIESHGDVYKVYGRNADGDFCIETSLLLGAFGVNGVLRGAFLREMGVTDLSFVRAHTGVAYRYITNDITQDHPPSMVHVGIFQYLMEDGFVGTSYLWDFCAPGRTLNNGFGFFIADDQKAIAGFKRDEAMRGLFPLHARHLGPRDQKDFWGKRKHDAGFNRVEGAAIPMFPPGLQEIQVQSRGRGIAILGDAAGRTNPLSGEGIAEALIGGELGWALAEAVYSQDLSVVAAYAAAEAVNAQSRLRADSHLLAKHAFNQPDVMRELLLLFQTNPKLAQMLIRFLSLELELKDFLNFPTLRGGVLMAFNPILRGAVVLLVLEALRKTGTDNF